MSVKKDLWALILSLSGLPPFLAGQATVEHATISGAAAVAGSAQNAAKAIGGALKNLDGTLDTAGKKRPSASAPSRSRVARTQVPVSSPAKQQSAAPSQTAKIYEDPAGIKAGMAGDELLRRFGEPSMKITSDSGEQTWYYSRKDGGGQTQVRVLGGQVLSVDGGDKRPDAAAIE